MIFLVCWLAGDMKFQVKVEYGREKFVKFYVKADVVDGKVLRYSFSCGLRHYSFLLNSFLEINFLAAHDQTVTCSYVYFSCA